MIKQIKKFAITHPVLFIFGLAFFYVLIAGLFIQLIFLPFLAPSSMTFGDGLLAGYDGPKLNRIAVELSQKIGENGWSEWSLWPDGQIVSGIAAVFYTLIIPKPWVLLPLNGFLHGIASLSLWGIVLIITKKRTLALVSTLPFILFPSSLLWHAQLHNENYAVPAILLFFFGWTYIADIQRGLNLRKSWKAIICLLLGGFLGWAVRDYIQSVLSLIALILVLFLVILYFIQWIKKKIGFKKWLSYVTLIVSIWLLSTPGFIKVVDNNFIHSTKSYDSTPSFNLDIGDSTLSETQNSAPQQEKETTWWTRSERLPQFVDSTFKDLAKMRKKFIRSWNYAGSQIDTDIIFKNSTDVIKYVPRALMISLLAPFPQDWFTQGYKKSASLMRAESAFEMMFCYICLLGFLFSSWIFRARIEFWTLLGFTTAMLIIYACVIPNVGSLYRFRYPYYMPLICLGLSGVILVIEKLSHRNEKEKQ